jgi:hypothetical protein
MTAKGRKTISVEGGYWMLDSRCWDLGFGF